MTFVVVDEDTGELIACIKDNDNRILMKSGYYVVVYGNTEPVFSEIDGRVYIESNKFIINPYEVDE